jgi:hypothetical protein
VNREFLSAASKRGGCGGKKLQWCLSGSPDINGRSHGTQGVGCEVLLHQPYERASHLCQRVCRAGEDEHLVAHRLVCRLLLHRETLLSSLHMPGERTEGEPVVSQSRSIFLDRVGDPASVQGPHPEVSAEDTHDAALHDGGI